VQEVVNSTELHRIHGKRNKSNGSNAAVFSFAITIMHITAVVVGELNIFSEGKSTVVPEMYGL
jgi:hypothetical protein